MGIVAVFGVIAAFPQPLHAEDVAGTAEAGIENVLFIVADDLKASVLGCYGDKVCKTPNIDKLASEGITLNKKTRKYIQE